MATPRPRTTSSNSLAASLHTNHHTGPTGPPQHSPYDFCNAFWGPGDPGFDILTSRMKNAHRTMEELRLFWKERAAIEDEYAKRLAKLARTPVGTAETGALRQALATLTGELDVQSHTHLDLANHFRGELEAAALEWVNRIGSFRKNTQAAVEKSYKVKQTQESYVEKAKSKYTDACVSINTYTAQAQLLQGRELEKNQAKLEKAKAAVGGNEREYANFVRALQDTRKKWEGEWKAFCDQCQDEEEERVEFLRNHVWAYANEVARVCVADDEGCEKVRSALESVLPEVDLEAFVHEYGTGSQIAEPPIFVDFAQPERPAHGAPRFANFRRNTTRPLAPPPAPAPVPPPASANAPAQAPPAQDPAPPVPAPVPKANPAPTTSPAPAPTPAAATPSPAPAPVPAPAPAPQRQSTYGSASTSVASAVTAATSAYAASPVSTRPTSIAFSATAAPQPVQQAPPPSARQPSPAPSVPRATTPAPAPAPAPAAVPVRSPPGADAVDPITLAPGESMILNIGGRGYEVDPHAPPARSTSAAPNAGGASGGVDEIAAALAQLRSEPPPTGSIRASVAKAAEASSHARAASGSGSSGGGAAGSGRPRQSTMDSSASFRPPSVAGSLVAPPAGYTAAELQQTQQAHAQRASRIGTGDYYAQQQAAWEYHQQQQQQQQSRAPSPGPAAYQRAASPSPATYQRAASPGPAAYQRAASPGPSYQRAASPGPGYAPPRSSTSSPFPQYASPRDSRRLSNPHAAMMQPPTNTSASPLSVEEVVSQYAQSFPGERRSNPGSRRGSVASGMDELAHSPSPAPSGRTQQPTEGFAGIGARGRSPSPQPFNHPESLRAASPRPGSTYGAPPQRAATPLGIALDASGSVTHDQMAEEYARRASYQPSPQLGGYGSAYAYPQQPQHTGYPSYAQQGYGTPAPSAYAASPSHGYALSGYAGSVQRAPSTRSSTNAGSFYAGAADRATSPSVQSPQPQHPPQQPYEAPPPPQAQPVVSNGYASTSQRAPSPAPPATPSEPLFHVKALYDYTAQTPEEFDFQTGDVIAVFKTPEDGWWTGILLDDARRVPGRTLFPSNFVSHVVVVQ